MPMCESWEWGHGQSGVSFVHTTLFVDGLWQGLGQVAAGETQDSATKIDFGRIQTGYNYFSGQLRNIRFFPDVVANGE